MASTKGDEMAQATLIIRDNDEDGMNVKVRFDPEIDLEKEDQITQAQKIMLMLLGLMKEMTEAVGGSFEDVDAN
jgi:hypothetical protein